MKTKQKILNIIHFCIGFFIGKFSGVDMPIDFFLIIPVIIMNIIGIFALQIVPTLNIGEVFDLMLNKKVYILRGIEKRQIGLIFAGVGAIIGFGIKFQQISFIGSAILISSFCLNIGIKRIKRKYSDNFFEEN